MGFYPDDVLLLESTVEYSPSVFYKLPRGELLVLQAFYEQERDDNNNKELERANKSEKVLCTISIYSHRVRWHIWRGRVGAKLYLKDNMYATLEKSRFTA